MPKQQLAALVATAGAVLLGLGLLTATHAALAGPAPPSAAAATPAPPAPLTRRQLEHRVKRFVASVTGSLVSDDPVELWSTPVCPVLVGLSGDEGEHVFAHLESTVRALGIPLGRIGCQPNFQIIVTSQPDATINALAKSQPKAFAQGHDFPSFVNTVRPVRFWYNTQLAGRDSAVTNMTMFTPPTGDEASGPVGSGLAPTGGYPGVAVDATAPRFLYAMYQPLVSVIAVVDLNRVVGFDWGQIADYVAMAGLTRVNNLDATFDDAPTILRLFSAAGQERLSGLSDWDKALLKELYATSPYSRSQRIEVSARMAHDIESYRAYK
jgi:hypothetical protein